MKLSISELDLYRKGYVSIYVTATHVCNLHCPYCYDKKDCSKSINLDDARRIISEVESVNLPKYFYDVSGGEFMLINEWLEILELFLATGKEVSLNTNGTLIDEKTVLDLLALDKKYPNRLFLSVSLDSIDPDLNVTIRPGAKSNNVFRALQLLTKNGLRYRVAITLTSLNKDTILDTVRGVVEQYSKEFIIGILRPTFDQVEHGSLMVKKEEAVRILKEVEKLKTEIGDFEFYHCLDENWETFCEAGRDRICILPNGGVTSCYTLQQDSDVIGNIYTESLADILVRVHEANHERDNRCLLCEHQSACYHDPVYKFGT